MLGLFKAVRPAATPPPAVKSILLGVVPCLLAAGQLLGSRTWAAQGAAPCQGTDVVIDGTPTDTVEVAFDGRGWGQVITVSGTSISSVRFEMPGGFANRWSKAILYVMSTDVNGLPDTNDFPVFISRDIPPPLDPGYGVVPLVFTFDPPMTLPKIGQYFFDVNEDACFGDIYLLGNRTNAYAGGAAFSTDLSACDGTGPGSARTADPRLDFICDVTYCDLATPAKSRTWGQIKVIYR